MTSAILSRSLRWYVVQTKPKQEARAEANLREWGVETLAPRLPAGAAPSGSRNLAGQPAFLFPRYIFARFDAADLLHKVRLTRGVHDVVGFGEPATPVDDAVVTLIRSRALGHGSLRPAETGPGVPVTIVGGPLRSLVGIFERACGNRDRVSILLETIASSPTHACVDSASVQVLGARSEERRA